ncbi:MAG: glycoside hydrolase family 2 TIM barrel-domain containing protein [Flavobacteriaceae bacterium]
MNRIIVVLCASIIFSCKNSPEKTKVTESIAFQAPPAKVTIRKEGGKFQLFVDQKPFYIKGAGLEFGNINALASHHANSFRTWRTDNGERSAIAVLDEAYENGLMVSMGIEVGRERHGFDYGDREQVNKQLEEIKKQVMALKDHPALLIWGIGNELNLNYTNQKVWDAVNEISEMIHEIDPNHLTTTSLAGIAEKEVQLIKQRCPDLDILAVQMYGDLPDLPRLIQEYGWEGPYMVTEWGATGHWEVPVTTWGAPIEENSTVKAANYLKRYQGGIEADSLQCVGSYVFLWGNKQERTPTWYGIFLEDGQETESVDVMHYIWNGSWPENRTPKIESFHLDGKTAYDNIILTPTREYSATITTSDPENDAVSYRWEVLPESTDLREGGDYEERPKPVQGLFDAEEGNTLVLRSPAKGKYRLFVYATDGNGHSAAANIPFLVE